MTKLQRSLMLLSLISFGVIQTKAETIVDNSKGNLTKVSDKNGITVVDIDSPNEKGISVNNFTKFEVTNKGMVLNNSNTRYKTTFGVEIEGNKNLLKKEADIALLRVTGVESSKLSGKLEAASVKELDVFLANRNGIVIDGLTLENINRAVFTTGNITDDLKLFVNSGKIHITDKGLRGAGSIDLITYNLINQGKVSARDEININLGINRFDLSKKSNINTKEYEKLGKELNLKLNETTLTILGNLKSILDQRNEVLNKAILQPTSDVKIMAERRAKFFELNEKIMKYASLANETGLDLSVVGINIFDNGFISADMVKFNKIYKVIKDKNIEGIENLLNPVKDTASKYEFDKLTKDLGVKINEKTINAIAVLDYLIKEENAIISRVVLKFDTLTNNDKEKIKKDLAKLKVDIKSTLIFARENGVDLDNIGINLDSKGDVVYKDRNKFASVFNSVKKLNGLEQLFDTKGTLIYSNNKVDASQLGSMYSNKIKITSPDKWLNVETKEILAKNSINIDIKGDVLNKGAIEANNLVDIKANKLENIGSVDFSKGGYEVKWITRDGKVLSLDDINKVWNKKYGYNLTEEDTWLLMSGKLLNAWTYDVNFTKDKARSIYNRFNDVLNQLNAADKYTVLTREGKEIVRNKNIDKTFVNKGDIYATELDNQRILEAFAVSKTNAKQASIVSNDVNINLSNDLINRDAKIVANSNLNIKANKIENKNTLSGDILLKDGYETVSWDVIQKMYQGRVIGAERYEINYERGLKEDKDARKTKVSAINKSIISGNNINIEAKNIKLVDEKNTGSSINSKNSLVIKTDVLEMNGQNVEATKSVDITAQNINIKDSGIYSSDVKLTSNKLSMTSKKEKEIVLRTDKELLTREYVLGSTIDANKNISLNVNELELKGAVIRADENISLKGNKLDLLSEKIVKDYKSAYSISKSFRTVKNNERLEQIVGSYITGKNINIAYKNLTTKASGILSSNNIGVNGNNVNLGTSVVKYELDKRIGIDNGILGINYKNIQKNIESTVGSVVLSKGDISVKVDKEFNLSGSKIKGHKVDIEASNVNINSTKDNSTTKTESRNLLGGDLTGSAEYNKTDTNISAKVDMEIYKKEKEVKKEEKNNKSIVEGENVNINAKKDVNIKGSDIKGGDVKISGENVNVTSKEIKKETEKDSVSHNISVGVSAGVGEKGNSVAANVDYKVKHENTKTSETKNEGSSISGENVTITGNNVNVKGSEVSAKDKVDINGNVVNISNDIDKANVTKTLEELGIKLDVNVREKTLGIIGTVKKLIDERNNLLGYVLNPVAGYNKAIEYEKKLEDNLETIKKTVSEIQKNGISPETLGLELTASGEVKYTMEKINIVENAIKSSVIKAKNITVKADKVNITGSKVEGGKVNVITKDLNMNGAVENTSTNKTNVVVEATGSHDFVKDTTTGGVSASTNVSGNNKSKVVEATIKADEVNVKVENDANLTGANIKADKGEVRVGKNLNVNNVNDKEVKYSAGIGAEDTTTSNPKVGANGSVEYISKNENKSGIDIKESTVTVKGNKNETNETSINAKVNGSISNDGDNTKVTVGATTKIEGSNDKVSGKAEIGLNLDTNINGKGKVENSNISSKVDADVNIKGDGKVLGDTNISINSEINGNSNGITSNNKGKINTEVNLTGKNVEGKVKLGAEGNLGVDEKNNISVDGKGNANGTVTIKGETENVSGNVTLNGNLNVAGGRGKETTSDVNSNANGKVVIKGETGHVNGNLTFTGNGEFAANNKDGVTKAEGTGNANGTVTIKGETENVSGNVTLNGNLNVAGGKGKETTSDVNANANGKVVIKGETEHVNGNLTFTGNGEFAANNKDGVTKAEGTGNANGTVTIKGETENVSGNVTLNGNLNVAGGKGKETTSDVNANANGKVVIKGETEHVNGNLTFTGNGEFAANNKDGVTKAEGTGNTNGTVTIKGETENVSGNVTLNGNLNVAGGKGKETTSDVNANANGKVVIKGETGNVNGNLTFTGNGEFAANNKDGVTKAEGTGNANGTVTIKGETENVSGNVTLNGNLNVAGGKGKETTSDVNANANGKVVIKGETEHVNGNLTFTGNGEFAANNKDGVTKAEGTGNTNGTVTIKGETENVSGNVTLNGNLNVAGGKGKETTSDVNANANGKVVIKGETEHVNGNLTFTGNGEFAANNKDGVTKVEGTGNANGTVTIKGETENVAGNVTLNGNLNVAGGKGKETTSDVNSNANGKVVIKGETGNVNGNLTFTGNGEFAANNKDGVTKAEGTGNANGTVTIKGETENVSGNVTLNGNLNVAGGKGKETTSDVNANANGKVVIKGETEHVNGNLTFTGNGEFAANNKDGVTKAEVIGISNGDMVLKNTEFNKINNKISDLHLTLLTNKVKLNKNNLKEIKISLENGEKILVDNEIDSK